MNTALRADTGVQQPAQEQAQKLAQKPVKSISGMPTTTKTAARELGDIRREIDAVDDGMQDLLIQRSELVREVARAKAEMAGEAGKSGFVAFRPGREAEVLRRLAHRHTGPLPLAVVFRVWREIISNMTQLQGSFRVQVFGADNKLAYWDLARNYYGSSTEMLLHETARDVLRDAAQDRGSLALLPVPGHYAGGEWWTTLTRALPTSPEGELRVVARIPFIQTPNDPAPAAFVVSMAGVEATGDDTSLLAVETEGVASDALIVARVKAAGFEATRVAMAEMKEGRFNLFTVPGHVAGDDARLAELSANAPIVAARIIGTYANPVRLSADGKPQ